MPPPSTPRDTFLISLPTAWDEIEAASTTDDIVGDLRAAAEGSAALTIEQRRELLVLERMLRQAPPLGARFQALLAEDVDLGDHTFALVALCVLVTRTADELGTGTIGFEELQQAASGEPDEPFRRLEAPQVIQATHGMFVRDRCLAAVTVDETDPVEQEVMQVTYSGLIGSGEGLAVLTFLSPNVQIADEMTEMFDAIADTLEFVAA